MVKNNKANYFSTFAFKLNKIVMPNNIKANITDKISSAKAAIEAGDADQIQTASDELQEALQKAGEAVYSQSGSDDGLGSEGADSQSPKKEGDDDGDTVEGEFREV